ncbi:hypothetical protein M3G03_06550 [Aestuariimicrobium sp. p3-SID1156]|uniref:hypothetical protein n=1 Tax=Aestuariimicrobium sp. p3-SID1156 TaxID=2916038 RepID=UPI00223A90A2|nr:hypothetical protein [Aestuariimicrobium sp. p3-SID1156]MCT1459198.1 hypothetical protein [Aestuariimicrobium sp. p3-SID1156]
MVVPLSFQAAGDIGQSDPDPVLVSFQGVEVDGVGEVGFEEFVCFGFQPLFGGGEVVDGLGPFSQALIEGRFDPFCELCVGGRGGGDLLVAVGDELFGDADGHSLPRAAGAFGGSAGADVVVNRTGFDGDSPYLIPTSTCSFGMTPSSFPRPGVSNKLSTFQPATKLRSRHRGTWPVGGGLVMRMGGFISLVGAGLQDTCI